MVRHEPRRQSVRRRGGFSLIELMIVIVIIAILAGFLLVAVQNARTAARTVGVTAEIKSLEKAIADFKMRFGVEPPSYIRLHEQASGWTNTDVQTRTSKAILREIWPSFDFTYNGTASLDLNSNGTPDEVLDLCGAECLAFFLGGMQERPSIGASTLSAVRGFSSNPATPFIGLTGTRIGPFMEFDPARFVDRDADGIFEYMDPIPGQTNPYQYFSSYGGKGYRINGLDTANTVAGHVDDEMLRIPATPPPSQATMTSVYNQSEGTATSPATPYKANSYQIISPGFDGEYGFGGYCHPENGVRFSAPHDNPARDNGDELRKERDNITNFKAGPLG
ncbi:MAG: prepilin-type N-terminal cleavage/methylation domain-containing protein [Planctomyces sp.]|nr:prepilin-type N-terminal cleavage/methylation domain-containing protein [Planctomyces sp.]